MRILMDFECCYRVVQARDARFDGRLFVGVASTGIYCRPVCTVRTPRRENCRFFPSAAAAEQQGYRPCLRCRPELAPGNTAMDAGARLAQAAAGLIDDDMLNEAVLEALPERLGVTDLHLRRLFECEFGVSPVQYVQTQRLLLAKCLLTDTALPLTEVATAGGFGSVRRFNALFKQRYRLVPSALRKHTGADNGTDVLTFELGYRPPLDWNSLLGFLAQRAVDSVEHVEGNCYWRTVELRACGRLDARHVRGWIAARPASRKPAIQLALSPSLSCSIPAVLARAKRLFDLACDPNPIAATLGTLGARHPGLRLPGSFDGFEVAVRAVLGQQITVRAARTLAGRFASAFGEPIESPHPALRVLFPSAQRVAGLTPERIAEVGVIAARARAIVALARAVADGELRLEPGADVERTLERLRSMPGIGEWTAQYIGMRALAWPDAFPHTDFGVLKAMGERDARAGLARASAWQPWRAYAVMHLWKSLEDGAA
jgi:AraC family transcriptional regulator of adaptative response / DNA-3-methyladenine glycosylase II